jgi:hypothetical protein
MLEVPRSAAHVIVHLSGPQLEFREAPAWLPRGVMEVATQVWPTLRPAQRAHLLRIACDPEMDRAWKELREGVKSKPPTDARVSAEWRRRVGKMHPPPLDPSETTLGLLFLAACSWSVPAFDAPGPTNIEHAIRTKTEHHKILKKQAKRIENARELAQHFRLLAARQDARNFDAKKYAQYFDDAGDILEQEMDKPPASFIVTYDSGDRRVRAYVLHLAQLAKDLFGRVNYSTVARVTNVALKLADAEEISRDDVRAFTRDRLR